MDFHPVSGRDLLELTGPGGFFRGAVHPAAVSKGATGRGGNGRGDIPPEEDAPGLFAGIGDGYRGNERLGIGMKRIPVDFIGGPEFDNFAQVHDGDPVADVFDHGKVVGDEKVGEMEFLLEAEEKVKDLALHGDIEGGDGFITNNELGIERESPGDSDALALPPGKFKGEALGGAGREPDNIQELEYFPAPHAGVFNFVDEERLFQERLHGMAGIEGFHGILEDHLDVAPVGLHLGAAEAGDLISLEVDGATGGIQQPDDALAQGGLAATRFTDKTECLPGIDMEGNAIHRFALGLGSIEHPAPDRKIHSKVIDGE